MWQLFRATPLRYVYSADYGWTSGEEGAAEEPWNLELDPIQVHGNIMRPPLSMKFAESWRVINDPEYFGAEVLSETLTPASVDYIRTSARYKHHIRQLCEWGLLTVVAIPLMIARFFAVVKHGGEGKPDTARTIYDGRNLNKRCAKPPPVNIPDPIDAARYAASLHPRKLAIYLADFRHFFHQFAVHPNLHRYFCVAMEEEVFGWTTLPISSSYQV